MSDSQASLRSYRSAFLEIQSEAHSLLGSLTEKQFNRKPAPDKWSVGQCIHHLLRAGEPLALAIQHAIAEAPDKRNVEEPVDIRHGLFGSLFIYALRPSTQIPMPAPQGYRPAGDPPSLEDTRQRFLQLQTDFCTCIDQSTHLDVNRIRVSSPATTLLYFRLGTWFEATMHHERRHIQQAKRVITAVGITS